MLKAICKNLVWMAVPLSLAVGCATHETTTTAQADYGPTPVLTPTSGEPEQRIYSTDPSTLTATSSLEAAPPAGVNSSDWGVAEAIRERLISDPTLAPMGSNLITEVGKDGVVTLKGVVKTEEEKERVHNTIANVPGVTGVNDQLKIGTYHGKGNLDMNQPQP